MPLQRNPTTGKRKRNPETGKRIRGQSGDACCCGGTCPTCQACAGVTEAVLIHLDLHLPTWPGSSYPGYPYCEAPGGGGEYLQWLADNNGDGCWQQYCYVGGYADGGPGYSVQTQGDTDLIITLQRADTLISQADWDARGLTARFNAPRECVFVKYESPGTSVVVKPYTAPVPCVVSDTYPLGDALDFCVTLVRRDPGIPGSCCREWELQAWLGYGDPLSAGGSGAVFNLFIGFKADADGSCSFPFFDIDCDPNTYTDCTGAVNKPGAIPNWYCYLKENATYDEDGNCTAAYDSSCGSASVSSS